MVEHGQQNPVYKDMGRPVGILEYSARGNAHCVNQQEQLPHEGALQPQGVLREVGEAQEPPFRDL